MKTVKINRYRVSQRVLAEASAVLLDGGVVAFPTETAYGLAADPRNSEALDKIYKIKNRPKDKRLPLVAASKEQVSLFFALNKATLGLADKHWPGPLTVILPVIRNAPLSAWGNAAVRVPASVWSRALPDAIGHPITSTSANLSGQPNCYSASYVRSAFHGQKIRPDLILDAGQLPPRIPSTIVTIKNGKLSVLRQGTIRVE